MQVMKLSMLFPSEEDQAQILAKQELTRNGRRAVILTRPIGEGDHEVMAMAAVNRDPGRSDEILASIQDFQTRSTNQRQLVEFYWNVYENEGIINNGVNKIAAMLSSGGEFRIRNIRKGKTRGGKNTLGPEETFLAIMQYWMEHVNASAENAVVTGSRGIRAIQHQGVRQALVEGSWVGRTVWFNVQIPGLSGTYSLPLNIQTLSTANLEPVKALEGTGIELFYWVPNADLLQQLQAKDKDTQKLLKKYVPTKLATELIRNRKVLLDPSLLLHVKNRGTDRRTFGESIIQPALSGIAYRRTVDQLDVVTMSNLINRLTIVMVGSSDPASPYSAVDVANARMRLMNTFFEDPGPNMTVVWAGDDVKVQDIGAHQSVMDLDGRHTVGENKVKVALGVPDALLTGTTNEGKAAGWASAQSAAAEMQELQHAFSQVFTTMAERIALENGFTELDVIFEADESNMVDKLEERTQARADYLAGLLSVRTSLMQRDIDPDAEYVLRCKERGLEPGVATWEEAFMPPQGLAGQGADGTPQGQGTGKDPGAGRQKQPPQSKPSTEKRTTQENQ